MDFMFLQIKGRQAISVVCWTRVSLTQKPNNNVSKCDEELYKVQIDCCMSWENFKCERLWWCYLGLGGWRTREMFDIWELQMKVKVSWCDLCRGGWRTREMFDVWELQMKVKVSNVTLAWKDGLKLNSGPLNRGENIFKIWLAECGLNDEELKGHCLADLERWFETKPKASEEEKHLEIGVAECGMTDEEWKKYCLQSWFGNMVWN